MSKNSATAATLDATQKPSENATNATESPKKTASSVPEPVSAAAVVAEQAGANSVDDAKPAGQSASAEPEVADASHVLHVLEIDEFDQSSFELAFDTDQATIHAWADSGAEAVVSRVAKIPLAESEEMIATARVVRFEHKRRAKAAKELERLIRKRVREASKMRINPALINGK